MRNAPSLLTSNQLVTVIILTPPPSMYSHRTSRKSQNDLYLYIYFYWPIFFKGVVKTSTVVSKKTVGCIFAPVKIFLRKRKSKGYSFRLLHSHNVKHQCNNKTEEDFTSLRVFKKFGKGKKFHQKNLTIQQNRQDR